MTIDHNIAWEEFATKFPPELVDELRNLFSRGGPFEISAKELSSGLSCNEDTANRLLDELSPPLERRVALICSKCGDEISTEDLTRGRCGKCDANLTEADAVKKRDSYHFDTPPTRDVLWVLALHGMNTRGDWQETFNWRVSTSYKRSVPVAIYKYGIVRPGALCRWSLTRLEKRVIDRIHTLQGDTEAEGFQGPPDVIAHSLGTWLIGHALKRNPELKIGRLLLTGCILRPDFDWKTLQSNGQVEAVLNHYGTKDFWAGIAHYVIPDSGPSGRIGFVSGFPVVQVRAEGFGHSDYFTKEHFGEVFKQTWQPFLSVSLKELQSLDVGGSSSWSCAAWPFRATIFPAFLLVFFWTLVFTILVCTALGIIETSKFLLLLCA
ncbi:MAG TPA: hypothetical protein VK578_13810 [Edaphobacter sp.]|nr:hypothetical protein [Edaphobacter sp.]